MSLTLIAHECCALHHMTPGHPESPQRIAAIERAVTNSEILDSVQSLEAKAATVEQLALAHDQQYINSIQDNTPFSGLRSIDPDTHMNPYTWDAALFAAGSGIQAVDLVMSSDENLVFCNVRPPGHHAEHNKAMGFCFFNNIAIAAKYAEKQYGLTRIAIIDFDVHHGNGTQDILQYNDAIHYFSSFQHPFYPDSEVQHVADNIHNILIPAHTTGDVFQQHFEEHCIDVLNELKPELILISAGFDAHYMDPLANLLLTEYDYYCIAKKLANIANQYCNGRVVSMLEGGYSIPRLSQSVLAHLFGLSDYSLTSCIKKLSQSHSYPWIFEQWITLKNHRNVLIRPVRTEDKSILQEFTNLLSKEDLSARFFGASNNLADLFINRLMTVDYEDRIALIACSQSELNHNMVVGTVELVINHEKNNAEFAIITRSDLKGQGIGHSLMLKAIEYCRDRGLTELHGEVLIDNTTMIRLVSELGFIKRADYGDGTVYASMSLSE